MRKLFIGIFGLSLLLFAAVSFARPWGNGQNYGNLSAEQKQFFDATRELRKEMHDKRFLLMEYYRTGEEQAKIDALEGEINSLRSMIQTKAQELGIRGAGSCGNSGADCAMGQGMGCNGKGCGQQANAGCGKMNRCGQQ